MTIIIALKVAAGLVLAADSRLTIQEDGRTVFLSDTNTKLFALKGHPVGIMTCGSSFLQGRAVASWLESFANHRAPAPTCTFEEIVEALVAYLPPPDQGSVTVVLAGFGPGATQGMDAQLFKVTVFASGEVHRFDLSNSAIFWDGEFEAITRLLLGFAPVYGNLLTGRAEFGQGETRVPYYAFTLEEGVDYLEFLATTQVRFQRFASVPPTCGGPIDVATITPEQGFVWVESKKLRTSTMPQGQVP